MTRTSFLALIAAMGLAAAAVPLGAQTPQDIEELRDARRELQEARQALEEAAREVARLSAQTAGPVVRSFSLVPRPALLGITISDGEDGVRVDGVTPGGPAAESGVETGDVIVAMDDAVFSGDSSAELLVAQMDSVSPGDAVVLTIVRDGDEEEVEVVAGTPAAFFSLDNPGDRRFDVGGLLRGGRDIGARLLAFGRRWGDMELAELTPELGAYFGTETGILVVRAPDDDVLEALMDGDVILDIGGRTPNSTAHALRILASFETGETLELTIMRNQRRQTLEVEFP